MSCFVSVAHAQSAEAPTTHSVNPAPQMSEAPPPAPRRWYGWKALTMDGVALTLGAAAIVVADRENGDAWSNRFAAGATVAYLASGPTFHLIHGQPGHALGSLGLRGGLPILGALAWRSTVTCPAPGEEYGNCGLGPIVLGFAAGAVAAMALDATLLAWDRPERETPKQARLGLAPMFSRDGQRAVHLVGTF